MHLPESGYVIVHSISTEL